MADKARTAAALDAGRRRLLLVAGLACPLLGAPRWAAAQAGDGDAQTLLRAGGVVLALRHALAPGTFDPPGFRLGDCRSQRNLDDAGRQQARQIGAWFSDRRLAPAHIRSSPWCRCVDTATLAFGGTEVWPALGSPRGAVEASNAENLLALHVAIQSASQRKGEFELWVTHMFVLTELVGGIAIGSGDGLVLRAGGDGQPQLLARWAAPAPRS